MKIRKIHIKNFAGIKDKTLNFNKGFNLIYGENEAGKSSIENFIKIWFYGMDSGRGKFGSRKKYIPLSGEKISGELFIEHQMNTYIIKRTFGITKKDDFCEIIDGITGEIIKTNCINEPGKYFFSINSATFSKTLFISQLGVRVDKDKEEEIMEKITNIYNTGEESVSVKKAVYKLAKRKKQLVGLRKSGELDLLKENKNSLNEELWEAYKLCEENIDHEESLLKKREVKINIKEQIKKLDLYKKYVKKTKLQKDYKNISKYLIKGEQLKRKEESISGELKKGNRDITIDLLDEINNKCSKYSNLIDVKQEKINKLSNLQEDFNKKSLEINIYCAFTEMGDNIYQKIYTLKVDQKNLEEKLKEIVNIQNSITRSKMQLKNKKNSIGNLEFIEKYRNEISELLEFYKYSLKELKYNIEIQNEHKLLKNPNESNKRINFVYLGIAIVTILFIMGILKEKIYIMIACLPLCIILIKLYLKYSLDIKNNEMVNKNTNIIIKLKNKVEESEEKLNLYIKETNCKNYQEFITKISEYDKFINYKDSMDLIIKEREEEIDVFNIAELKSIYSKNEEIISSLFNVLSCDNLDDVLEKVEVYEKIKEYLLRSEYEINGIKEEIRNIDKQLKELQEEILKKATIIGLDSIEISDLQIKLKEYKEKITSINEIKSELKNVEETYKVLLKDRNIEEIKEEMKEIISQDISYSYESEEEIDREIRKQSNELLNIEKEIKDLEYLIEKRYLGKRGIPEIEEEILVNSEKELKLEREFNALDLSIDVLTESFEEMRKNIGPDLNNKVVDKFKFLSNKNYEEAKISEDYKLKIRYNGTLFDGEILSNGAKDQLYLALRLSFIEMLFKKSNMPIFLDDAFVQYDDKRRKKALELLLAEDFSQVIFFTCQSIDKLILDKNNLKYNFINI